MDRTRKILAVVGMWCLMTLMLPAASDAQQLYGSVTGTVKDESGAAIRRGGGAPLRSLVLLKTPERSARTTWTAFAAGSRDGSSTTCGSPPWASIMRQNFSSPRPLDRAASTFARGVVESRQRHHPRRQLQRQLADVRRAAALAAPRRTPPPPRRCRTPGRAAAPSPSAAPRCGPRWRADGDHRLRPARAAASAVFMNAPWPHLTSSTSPRRPRRSSCS